MNRHRPLSHSTRLNIRMPSTITRNEAHAWIKAVKVYFGKHRKSAANYHAALKQNANYPTSTYKIMSRFVVRSGAKRATRRRLAAHPKGHDPPRPAASHMQMSGRPMIPLRRWPLQTAKRRFKNTDQTYESRITKLDPDYVPDAVDCDGDPLELLRDSFASCDITESPEEMIRKIRDRHA